MAYDTERKKFGREPFWYIEIEVDGVTSRFCQDISPLPVGFEGTPSLSGTPTVNPAQIDLTGGIGVRAKCSVSLSESMDYTVYGTLIEPVRFWARWRAENPYYLGQRISVFSGYIPESRVFDSSDFVRRDYIIESFSLSAGGVSISGKDPLKLADNDRAKAPLESNGALDADIDETATSFTLSPAGIGDSEYPATDGIVRIGEEVILYTTRTSDTFSGLTRGYYSTEVESHSEGDTAQLCLFISGSPYEIDYKLITDYAFVDTSYINLAEWQAESDNNFITTYTTLITEPTGVHDLLEEFAESCPHYMFYDDRVNKIKWKALSPPPSDATKFNYENNFVKNTTSVTDKQDMRVSTVICRFGIINPTKDLDETSNYRVVYVREDTDSVVNYGQRAYKTVNSRWIPSDNKTAAVLMGARVGRRFSDAPREFKFSLDPSDAEVWTGDSVQLQSDLIMQAGGGGYPYLNYQITSAGQAKSSYNYVALEHTYGASLPQDEDIEDPTVRLVYISAEVLNLQDDAGTARSLREYYEDVYGADPLDAGLDVRFIFDSSAVAGSSDAAEYSVRTGAWPELTTPILIQNSGLIVGKGGNGRGGTDPGADGGPAILLEANIRLNNLNIIGGGGGGGGGSLETQGVGFGGGGAGYTQGFGPAAADDGTYTLGGSGTLGGGRGGDLGQDGSNGDDGLGGTGGKAIELNGFAITYINTGTIYGDVS
jgi:hypothetical protein